MRSCGRHSEGARMVHRAGLLLLLTVAVGLGVPAKAGVNVFRIGAHNENWTSSILQTAQQWDQAAAAHNAYTWVNLRELALASPGTSTDTTLRSVVTTLSGDPALALWDNHGEPWWDGISAAQLQYSYCEVIGRGDPSWCAGTAGLGRKPRLHHHRGAEGHRLRPDAVYRGHLRSRRGRV